MRIDITPEGVNFHQGGKVTVMLLVPFYSFHPPDETRRAGCPLGLEMVAAELVKLGVNVIFADLCMSAYNQFTPQLDGSVRFGLTDNQTSEVLRKYPADVVGITSLFSCQSANVAQVAKLVRQIQPKTIIVEGGAHATGACTEVLMTTEAEVIVRGEGMITFQQFCEKLLKGQNPYSVDGISYKNATGIHHNPPRPFHQNLDELAKRRTEIPLHQMYDTPNHTGGSRGTTVGRHAYILTSLGCAGHCKFCASDMMSGPCTRFFGLKRLENEVQQLKKAGVTELIIEDDQFLADIPHAFQVMAIFKKSGLIWFEEGGISMFKLMKPGRGATYQQLVDKMAESGCYRFYLAIESANPLSLQASHKPAINSQSALAEEIVRYIATKGIEAVGGFMIGFKVSNGVKHEETLADMRHTVEYAKRLKEAGLAYVMLFIFTVLPGTVTEKELGRKNYTSHERASIIVAGLTPQELTDLRHQWMAEINEVAQDRAQKAMNWGV